MTAEPILTWLYVPGDRLDRFGKAATSGADRVIIDLEDAVAPARKEQARAAAVAWLREARVPDGPGDDRATPVEVRINALDTAASHADVAALADLPGLAAIRVPKAEDPHAIARLADSVGPRVELHLLVESARGLEAIAELARAHPRVAAIGLGEADLRSELGVADDRGLDWARGRIVVAAAAAGLPPPAMSVYAALDDAEGLTRSCHAGRALGFLGRAAIHPRQLPIIEAAFLPDDGEVAEAMAVRAALAAAEASGEGAAVLPGGRFVDRAMAGRAERILALAARRRT